MSRLRALVTASLLVCAPASQAASDAEIRQWLNELVGSALVLQELAAGHCSGLTRNDRIDVDAWYSWAASLASPASRAIVARRKTELIAQARTAASEWVANEFRTSAGSRPLEKSCFIYSGMFRTIRDAAEAELEDIEYRLRGHVTPRSQR